MSVSDNPQHIACPLCDALYTNAPLLPQQRLYCQQCGHLLKRGTEQGLAWSLGFTLAGLVFFGLSLCFPFLGFSISGREHSMTLLQSGTTLMQSEQLLLGLLVLVFNLLAPLFIMIILLFLGGLLRSAPRGWRGTLLVWLGRALYEIKHWNMVEVFVIGVLVSLTKISGMATIIFGLSFWAFMGFSFCLWMAVNAMDNHELWHHIRWANQ